ncbi:ABC transporter [Candidatus Falkowbacteria bacterium HGW-Falkowbacteria-2]|uniref:ABC transporter n=1 Tax=Candidatus Falkowbacteria bacterium HGW-Falkowbacteria-2 TaxID=2013769 RepID=A0A2N2E279_9BACT|nr:MAG: ABC transporter [Candidatus Falkowbacteria bacterium HGW-Falkowbacteria-2]
MKILLQVNNLSKEYGGQKIFSNLTFSVSEKQKIGVIGRNGAGKSTLFKILCNEEEADSGDMLIHTETTLGYLKQTEDWQNGESALDYLHRHSGRPEWRLRQVASKFELGPDKLSQEASSLSGGWRMRLKLTSMLLSEPNLFLLDEPSNYLDLNTLLLLENYLRSYRGSFLIISHDREFLKRTCEETLEISKSGCYHYPGDIESYLAFKEQKLNTLIKVNESLERQQEHWQDFVDRFRFKSSKAKQAQALIRKINKLEEKRITIEHQAGITRINIPPVPKRTNFALKINNLAIGYSQDAVASDIDFDCRSGEKLALLGLNGQGKTTLIKTLAGLINPLSGDFRFAANSRLAYHGQEEIDQMTVNIQAGDFLRSSASADIKTEAVLKMAGDFLFRDEDLKKPIGVLSGGERSRLLLAALLLSKPDILILDEPTCHLDFETTEALGQALQRFAGTVLFASHDRTFSSLLATGIVEIKNGSAKRRHEDYNEYVARLEKELWKQAEEETAPLKSKIEDRRLYEENRLRQKQIIALEKELSKLQAYKQELLTYFLENYQNYSSEKAQELEDIKRRIADKEELWLALSEEQAN